MCSAACEENVSKKINVYGIVQGVGFRPFIKRLADEHGIKGSVCNKGSHVEIHACASPENIEAFLADITEKAPPRARILKVKSSDSELDSHDDFKIIGSGRDRGNIFVSPDIATCQKCEAELFDKKNRRYLHPFINCTDCGPRLTILDSMPYDRERTSMGDFPMCAACSSEYDDVHSRRYHAQPVCCNDCGPALYKLDGTANINFASDGANNAGDTARAEKIAHIAGSTRISEEAAYAANTAADGGNGAGDAVHAANSMSAVEKFRSLSSGSMRGKTMRAESAGRIIQEARKIIRSGGIIAVKGIGGFHLCCDAENSLAVSRLRKLKNRPYKPFAVMMRDKDVVMRECDVSQDELNILAGAERPILLLEKKSSSSICEETAPGNPNIGVMLPYTPIHMLLFRYPVDPDGEYITDSLIMTSGNPSGAPICKSDEEAAKYLSPMCDMIISHDRDIRIRADDTVMRCYKGKPYMIRRSRGYAPLPVMMGDETGVPVIAFGGELKNTFCLAEGAMYYLSPHIGDMANIDSINALSSAVERMTALLEIEPLAAVCDLHPAYNTSAAAKEFAANRGIRLIEVQHHYAHAVSCMAENDYRDDVIAVVFDGTGYGVDGTIWGGEILRAGLKDFERLAHIEPFVHAGGDVPVKEGWRTAYSIIDAIYGAHSDDVDGEIRNKADASVERVAGYLQLGSERERQAVRFMLDNGINTVSSTSMGRIFDAVSAILGIKSKNTFEGEMSMALEFAAENAERSDRSMPRYFGKMLSNIDDDEFVLCTTALIREILELKLSGGETDVLARFFHEALADMVVMACCYIRTKTELNAVVLSGGVFQNMLLLELCEEGLKNEGFTVLKHSVVPANDGGIALGQAVIAAMQMHD